MATTNSGFVVTKHTAVIGSTVVAAPAVLACDDNSANVQAAGGGATRIDAPNFDLATQTTYASVAKNGAVVLSLSGTTPQTVSLLDLTNSGANQTAGDTVFATTYILMFVNLGAASFTVGPGGSDPANMNLGGTSPTVTVEAGATVVLTSIAGLTVNSSHCNITVTPSSGGEFAMAVAGA